MPIYDYECQRCFSEFEERHSMNSTTAVACPACGSIKTMKVILRAPLMRMPDAGWEHENRGRGRYMSQMADGLDDPKAYFRSRGEAKEACKRAGLRVQDA